MNVYGIIGGTLWGNRGAEAMVTATIGRVRDRDPEARFLLLSYQSKRDRHLLRAGHVAVLDAGPERAAFVHLPFAMLCWLANRVGLRVPDVLLPQSTRALRRCRALFDVSGISFHDGRLSVVAYNLVCLWPAILLGVPVIRLSQAMGPFEHPLNRFPARQMLQRSLHTFVRGHLTAEYVRKLGVPEQRWSIAPDVAFAFESRDSLTQENEERVARVQAQTDIVRDSGRGIVALVPSSLVLKKMHDEGTDYVALLHQLICDLQQRGRHVLVLPNATSAGVKTLRNNDIAVITALRTRLLADSDRIDAVQVSYVDFDLNTQAIRRLLERTELVITSRFHAMVAALDLGVPTLVMGWSHKYAEVLEMFNCADAAMDFTRAEVELLPLVDRMLDEATERRSRISTRLGGIRAAAASQFDVLDRLNRE